jgi:ribosomal protein L11
MQPPVGPFLGQHGFNTNLFCKGFNDLTMNFPKSLPLRVFIKLFTDKSLLFRIKLPSISYLLFSTTKKNGFKIITPLDILKISFLKKIDYPNYKISSLTSMILGTAKSMKILIKKN